MDDILTTARDAGDLEPSRPLHREGGITLWRQIATKLESRIGDGAYPPASQLPTEAQLSAEFRVNRHTVRRALEELSRAGLLRIEQGRGTFVAEDVIEYIVEPRTRFSEWIRRHNKEPSGRVLQLREIAADATIAAGLGLRAGARVILFERLGFADGRPVNVTKHYFSAARFPGLLEALRVASGVTEALRMAGLADYRRQVTRVTARMPNVEEARLLESSRTRPLLVTENVNVDSAGAVIEFAVGLVPTPRVQIVFEP